jgi:signal transduction histidine kinase
MTQSTSAHGGGLSGDWTDPGQEQASGLRRWRTIGLQWRIDWLQATPEPASLQHLAVSVIAGLILGLTITSAAGLPAAEGASGGLSALRLAALLVACVLAALVALRPRSPVAAPAPRRDPEAADEPSQLLAQMHHELRTPLNAMIGFSQVMLHELHGPLGNARYQEYAAHISESGGRLLRASEDALAVAATMSALVADRRTLRRKRLSAAALLEEAWAALAAPQDIRFDPVHCSAVDVECHIECDRQATSQALQHLLGEAVSHTPPRGTITARSRCVTGARLIEIVVLPPTPEPHPDRQDAGDPRRPWAAGGLRVMLARSLLEMQDATLSLNREGSAGAWSAHIAFPLQAGLHIRPRSGTPSAGIRRLPFPARRGGFVAAAAARASAGSHAAPPA